MGREVGKGRQPVQDVRAGDCCERQVEFSIPGDLKGTAESMPRGHAHTG